MSRDIRKIRRTLFATADDHARFGFGVEIRPLMIMEETYSYVCADDVVGREGDATNVIRRLLGSAAKIIGFLTIVGVGGVGKTSLAKVVLADERIKSEFPVRLWVSVSDQGGAQCHLKDVLLKILESVGHKLPNCSSMEYVQSTYQSKLKGKKFLLVLDDVWTENLSEWQNIRSFLRIGGRGSRIIVTTRSWETANVIGDDTYELEGLSKANAWLLFEMIVFRGRSKDPKLVEIGEKIVEKCCNVPLALKVIGSLLNCKPIHKWQALERSGIAGTSNGMNKIMSVLKFSYDHLECSLKNCFAYCALFPKSYVINKRMLMNLWEAQGYIVPFDKGQSIENACEEHFSLLLQRCFFHEVNKDDFGDVESFKIHDLMHDLAQNVSGEEIFVINLRMPKVGHGPRHVFDARPKIYPEDFAKSKLRTYLMFEQHDVCGSESCCMDNIVKNWLCLRALAFNFLSVKRLPDTMGKLLHLRYLNLANSQVEKLPDSITDLHNLRTLDLSNCHNLREWPKNFTRLSKLTHLKRHGCERLCYMPVDMGKLSHLCVLDEFVMKDESESEMQHVKQLQDLKAVTVNLKGQIYIRFHFFNFKRAEQYEGKLNCLEAAKDLQNVNIHFGWPCTGQENDEENRVSEEAAMEKLQPHRNLREFTLSYYSGQKIGKWGRAQDNWATVLPNLVCIHLSNCRHLQQIPSFSKMLYLKSLHLNGLEKLEYMEEDITSNVDLESPIITFFPSLESLEIRASVKLQGWWRSGYNSDMHHQPAFPRLSQVTIIGCPDLTSFPHCPNLQTLSLKENNEALRITAGKIDPSSSFCDDDNLGLIAELDRVDYLKSLPPQLLTGLYLSNNIDMKSLSEAEEMFKKCSSSLLTLEIQHYNELTSLCGGLEHLTALQSLTLEGCKELKLLKREHNYSKRMPWKPLSRNLRRLKLDRLNVEILPSGMQYLTSLEHLHIKECVNLKALPKWVSRLQSLQSLHIESCRAIVSLPEKMKTLTSLKELKIHDCSTLEKKCKRNVGEDWPKIKHIPRIDIQ
ncbi:hypothetical protein RND81_09G163800 [Saponaria officinalis]